MTGYINLSDFLLDQLKLYSNTKIYLNLFEKAVLKSNYCSQEEFNRSMKFLLDSDKIEYKVDKNGIYVEIKNRGHSPWVNIPVGRSEYPDSYNPGDTDPCIVPSENSIPYATNDSGGWSTISNIRWYAGGSVGCDWNLSNSQLIVGSEPEYKFILDVSAMSITVSENSERIPIESFNYTKTNDNSDYSVYSITFGRQYQQQPINQSETTIAGHFKIILPLDDTESIKFLVDRSRGTVCYQIFLIKINDEQYKCQIESMEFNYNCIPYNEYKFRFSGSRIQ